MTNYNYKIGISVTSFIQIVYVKFIPAYSILHTSSVVTWSMLGGAKNRNGEEENQYIDEGNGAEPY